jgi:hypothetical protein
MKTPFPWARKIGNAGNSRQGMAAIAKLLARRQFGNVLVFPMGKGSANRAGCRYER